MFDLHMASPNGQLAMNTMAVKGIQSNRNRRSATARFNRYMLVTHCNAKKNVILINVFNQFIIKCSKRHIHCCLTWKQTSIFDMKWKVLKLTIYIERCYVFRYRCDFLCMYSYILVIQCPHKMYMCISWNKICVVGIWQKRFFFLRLFN